MALNQVDMYILCTFLLALATATVIARMRVRKSQNSRSQMDDWTACGGLVSISCVILVRPATLELITYFALIGCALVSSWHYGCWNSEEHFWNAYNPRL
jgi:hypothetical protein